VETIAESPVAVVLVAAAVILAVLHEVADSSRTSKAMAASKAMLIPFVALSVAFWVISLTRIILILQ